MPSTDPESPTYSHLWDRLRAENPEHSAKYSQRWRDLAAEGHDLDGEARLVAALAAPGAAVLDAGSGTGRVGGYLAEHGYAVVGVDLDEQLVAEAGQVYPGAEWLVGDLARFDFSAVSSVAKGSAGLPEFDVIVSAGNVLTFLDPDGRGPALERLRSVLAPDGRMVTGFGAGRGYSFADYERDLAETGFEVQHRFSTWNMRPFEDDSDFLVCVAVPG
ncbi:MAG: class I SAM-dependent methyltransferase [Leucobacter sp.]